MCIIFLFVALLLTIDFVEATFYAWADLSGLPAELDNGLAFFEEALKYKVIVVPGIFFDIHLIFIIYNFAM